MGRKGNRVRIAPCIYRDGSGLSATVNVGRTVTEKRFPADGIEDARDWQAAPHGCNSGASAAPRPSAARSAMTPSAISGS
jgi:hypothetical protein